MGLSSRAQGGASYRQALGEARQALAMPKPDAGGEPRLVLYVVPGEANDDPARLRRQLADALPEHLVPAAVVVMDAFPLTAHGKVDRAALPLPVFDRREGVRAPPRTPAERILADLWEELLGVADVGRDDHFFELGGHSLAAITLIERLRAQGFGTRARDVFTTPVLSALADTMASAPAGDGMREEIRL